MNRIVCFLMVGLAFTALQVATVSADHETSGVPATTGDDTHNTTGENCANAEP